MSNCPVTEGFKIVVERTNNNTNRFRQTLYAYYSNETYIRLIRGEKATIWQPLFNGSYGTSEKPIGVWTDGKPIYRKVLTATPTILDNWNYVSHNISNLGLLVNFYGSIFRSSNQQIPIQAGDRYQNSIIVTDGRIAYRTTDSNLINVEWTMVIEYTKTTD